jgi:hypothetical protein
MERTTPWGLLGAVNRSFVAAAPPRIETSAGATADIRLKSVIEHQSH